MRRLFTLLALLALARPAHADMYPVSSLDWTVFSATAVVRARVMAMREGRAWLQVSEVLAGTAGGEVVEAFAGPLALRAGDEGLFALFVTERGTSLSWIGHPVQGPAVVLDKRQRVIEGDASIEAYIRERAAWDRAHPAPPGSPPLSLDLDLSSPDLAAFAMPSVDNPSGLLVPPDPELWPLGAPAAADPALAALPSRQIDLRVGTINVPAMFTLDQAGGTDSALGRLVEVGGGLVIHYDIGMLAGLKMNPELKPGCTWYAEYTLPDGRIVTAGVLADPPGRLVVSVTHGQRYGSHYPANFAADVQTERDRDAVVRIAASYLPAD